jgi:glycosyltransferase involved in cell wall biosynthesis
VVATRIGGIPEIVADGVNGVLAASPDASDIAAAIERFLTLNYGSLSANALENAKRFDYDTVYVPAIRQAILGHS